MRLRRTSTINMCRNVANDFRNMGAGNGKDTSLEPEDTLQPIECDVFVVNLFCVSVHLTRETFST